MKSKSPYVIVLILLIAPPMSWSQWMEDSVFHFHTRRGIDYTYNLQFEEAQEQFRALIRLDPDHPGGYFFLAMVEWWRILIDIDNTEHDARFYRMLERVIDLCDRRLAKNPDDVTALFFKGGAIGSRGRLRAYREEWVRAANDGRLALPIVRRAFRLAPDNVDVLLGIGIYNYYAEAIPERYPFVKPLMVFFPKGDRQKGIEQLHTVAERAVYADTEAAYFLARLYFSDEKQYHKSLEVSQKLHARFPNNPLFHRSFARSLASLGMWADTKREYDTILSRVEAGMPGYDRSAAREAEYYLGMYEMAFGRYEEALARFTRCDRLSRQIDGREASGFRSMANLRMGMIYDVLGQREHAVNQYREVLSMAEYLNSRTLARQYLQTPFTR